MKAPTFKQFLQYKAKKELEERAFENLFKYIYGRNIPKVNKKLLDKMEKPQVLTAKFKLVTVTKHEGAEEPKLMPVIGDSPENKQWSQWTPGGDLRLFISNPQCFGFFDHDHEYYMELKKVPKEAKKV